MGLFDSKEVWVAGVSSSPLVEYAQWRKTLNKQRLEKLKKGLSPVEYAKAWRNIGHKNFTTYQKKAKKYLAEVSKIDGTQSGNIGISFTGYRYEDWLPYLTKYVPSIKQIRGLTLVSGYDKDFYIKAYMSEHYDYDIASDTLLLDGIEYGFLIPLGAKRARVLNLYNRKEIKYFDIPPVDYDYSLNIVYGTTNSIRYIVVPITPGNNSLRNSYGIPDYCIIDGHRINGHNSVKLKSEGFIPCCVRRNKVFHGGEYTFEKL